MKELEQAAFREEVSPTFDEFKARLDANGDFDCGYNNLWMNAMIAPDGVDAMMKGFFQGEKIADHITDIATKQKFLELCKEHTDSMYPIMDDREKKKAFLLSDECNNRLWEMYKLARANDVTHKLLCG